MPPIISIIIPCYNSGKYLLEAIHSVEKYPDKNVYEIVVVNDGSTESDTITLLNELKKRPYKIIDQENKGPAAARNNGVKISQGEYLLFLDSDNMIKTTYIDKGIEVLSKNTDVGVVYGNPTFFGENTGLYFMPKEFDFSSLLHSNYIDTCAVVRRKAWDEVGGFDENRELSQEDWEFWIRVAKSNWKFKYINEILYEYRIRGDSHVTNSLKDLEYKKLLKYVYSKHIDLFDDYVDLKFLEVLLPCLTVNKKVGVAFVDSNIVDAEDIIHPDFYKKFRNARFKTDKWNHDYIKTGVDEIRENLFFECTINNTSAMVFKKDLLQYVNFNDLKNFKYCGDWYFFISLLKHCDVAYKEDALSFFKYGTDNFKKGTRSVINYFKERFMVRYYFWKELKPLFSKQTRKQLYLELGIEMRIQLNEMIKRNSSFRETVQSFAFLHQINKNLFKRQL
ncbi:glycosyltransferase family 2 protein, partial [bacterium]